MVQSQGFRITVRKPTGDQFPEVHDPRSGDIYVVASPGELFQIHYEVLPPRQFPRPTGQTALYRFETHVDGKSIGCRHTAYTAAIAVGFVRQGDERGITYDLFKFAEAASDGDTMAESLAFAEGRIRVAVEEVEFTDQEATGFPNGRGAHAPAAVASLPEGKKFFLAPSLTTASGGTATGRGFGATTMAVVSDTLATFELRYETPSTLLLRKILDRDNAGHAAILDSFPETRGRPPPEADVEVKQEGRRVKRERAPPEVIDLSGRGLPPPPERLAPGEELVCDLTGEGSEGEGAAPRWSKRRAVAEEVALLEEVESTQMG